MYGPAYSALLSNKVSDKRRNYLFGAERFSTMIGSTSAIFIAGLVPDLLERSGYGLSIGFRIVLLISILVLLSEIPFLYKIVDTTDELESLDGGSLAKTTAEKGIVVKVEKIEEKEKRKFWILDKESTIYVAKYTFANSLIAFGAGFVIPFMQLYFTMHYKAPMSIVASVFSITSLLMAISYLLVPKLAERIGSIRTIVFTQGVSIVMLIAIPLSYPYFTLAAIFYLIRTVLMNAASPIGTSYILGCVKRNERAFAASIFSLSYMISNSLSPPISGWIMANYNMDIPFFICATFYTIACGAYYFFFGNKDKV
jgi:MFS family permease